MAKCMDYVIAETSKLAATADDRWFKDECEKKQNGGLRKTEKAK